MHIVIADQLPSSAVELLRSVPGWTVDARSGRSAEDLARDLATADALVVRSATKVTADRGRSSIESRRACGDRRR
jgi:phosphoglycerate dehydrogenase-like enzyme